MRIIKKMVKKILVTGSLSYIGSVLTSYLEEKGFKCVGYDTGFFRNSIFYTPSKTETIFHDVRDITEKDLKNVDAVVHLAGISNDPLDKLDNARIYNPTRKYSLEIARLCKKKGIKFIFASSCSVYGVGGDDFLVEDSPVHPQTKYSLNKLQIENDLRSISDRDFSPIALRFATVFGPSPFMRFDLVVNMFSGMAFTEKVIVMNSDGMPWRPNVHIFDVCEAIRCAIELDYRGAELLVLNVGDNNNNFQVIQIAKIAAEAVGGCEVKFLNENLELDEEGLIKDRKIKAGVDMRTYKVSFAKIKKVFPGFECAWTIERGVKDMVVMFERFHMDREMFKRKSFYRLQQLEYLYGAGYLSDDLRWLKPLE